jgi:hypothetical protein
VSTGVLSGLHLGIVSRENFLTRRDFLAQIKGELLRSLIRAKKVTHHPFPGHSNTPTTVY